MDNITTVKDANGKDIAINLANIADFNGDIGPDSTVGSAKDARKNRVAHVHDVQFVDSKGNALDQNKLLADAKSGAVNIVALDVEMEATHSGPNHNYCIYYEDSMEKDAESFTNPFKKPVLKNHNSYSGEPLGRILQAWHGPSALTEDRSAIHLKTRITDQEAIPKFLDGRYGTVSIAGSMGTVTCNICGKTILKDGKFKFCGHWRGETYKDQVCYWGAKDIEYNEVSVVNNPADDFAQIMKVTVLTDKDEKKEGSNMDGNTNPQGTQTQASADAVRQSAQNMLDMIDQLLGKPAGTADSQNPQGTAPTNTNDGQQQTETPAAPAADPAPAAAPAASDSAELQSKLDKANADLADANAKVAELTTKLADSEAKLAKATTDLADAQAEAKSMKDMCLTLAASNKEMVVDNIIEKEKANGLADDKVANRKQELMAKSMKDLSAMSDSTETQPQQQRTPAQVTNPGLADTSKDAAPGSNGNPADANKTADGKSAKRTVDDFATDIIGKLFK